MLLLGERVGEALRLAKTELKELEEKKGGKGRKRRHDQDEEAGLGVSDRLGGGKKGGKQGGKNFKQNKKKRMK